MGVELLRGLRTGRAYARFVIEGHWDDRDVSVVGPFNDWTPGVDVLRPDGNGPGRPWSRSPRGQTCSSATSPVATTGSTTPDADDWTERGSTVFWAGGRSQRTRRQGTRQEASHEEGGAGGRRPRRRRRRPRPRRTRRRCPARGVGDAAATGAWLGPSNTATRNWSATCPQPPSPPTRTARSYCAAISACATSTAPSCAPAGWWRCAGAAGRRANHCATAPTG